jgi:prolyl-tRNA synthetase
VRHNGEKFDLAVAEIEAKIPTLLEAIQKAMFDKAKAGRDEKLATALNWKDFIRALEQDCMVLTPFCDDGEWEEKVKVRMRHSFCLPLLMGYCYPENVT